ncbi:MAG: DUF4097 domain-containing protein [Betaproteobacteria bacterium]|nr:DUF4097 domain-containing protein [Betaproteobacteria bacterium]
MNPVAGRLILVSSLLGLLLASGCGGGDGGSVDTRPWAEEPFSFEVPAGTDLAALELTGFNGSIAVSGAPGVDPISVTGLRRVQADTIEDANLHLADLKVEVSTPSGTKVLVKTVQPSVSAGRNYVVDYTISLPQDFDCTIRSLNGEITASLTLPPSGTVDIRVTNGNIDLRIPQSTSAAFTASVAIGSITLTNLTLVDDPGSTPNARIGTLNPPSAGGTISLHVVNGTITVHGV